MMDFAAETLTAAGYCSWIKWIGEIFSISKSGEEAHT